MTPASMNDYIDTNYEMQLFIPVIHYFAIRTVMLYGEIHSLFQNIVLFVSLITLMKKIISV